MRVVSLVPSVTESLRAWGVTPLACTRFCEQPDLPAVGGTKDPDVAAIVALAPDLVVMCDEENRLADAEAFVAAGLAVHECSPRAVQEVGPAMVALAAAAGVGVAAPATPSTPPLGCSAFVPIWRRPWMSMAGDTYGSSVLAALGVANVFADHGQRYPEVSLDEVAVRRPDVVVVPSEPYPFKERHHAELSALAPVVAVDGQDLFWWGVRTPAALVRLHRAIGAAVAGGG